MTKGKTGETRILREAELNTPGAAMHAIRLHEPGGVGALRYERVATPTPDSGQALVRVHAAAITRDELDWPVDRLPAIPSYEFSGAVAGIAPDVSGPPVDQAVFALAGFDHDGAAAEYVAVNAGLLAPKPLSLDHTQTAALPLAGLSAWQGLFDHGRLDSGQRVLILGAAGGVGHLAVQLASWRGAQVIGTASAAKLADLKTLGAHEVIGHETSRFEEEMDPVDLVFDTVGGDLLRRAPGVISSGGRLVSIAEDPPTLATEGNIASTYFVVEPRADQLVELAGLVDKGVLKVAIDSTFPLSEARSAFERSLERGTRGKIVLRVIDD
jgi:NADPH:quinone reductase-like Zn-dependent oxidoreductase